MQIFLYISSFVSPSPEIFKVKETFLFVEKIFRKDGRVHVEQFVSQHLGQQPSEEKKICCGVQMQSKSRVSMHVLKINRGLQSARRNKLHQFQSVFSRDMTPQAKARQRKSGFIWVITSQGCPSLSTCATPINKGPQRCVRKLTHFDTAWGGGHCCRSSNKQRWLYALYPRR